MLQVLQSFFADENLVQNAQGAMVISRVNDGVFNLKVHTAQRCLAHPCGLEVKSRGQTNCES